MKHPLPERRGPPAGTYETAPQNKQAVGQRKTGEDQATTSARNNEHRISDVEELDLAKAIQFSPIVQSIEQPPGYDTWSDRTVFPNQFCQPRCRQVSSASTCPPAPLLVPRAL